MNYKEFMTLRESKNIEDAKIKLKKANEALQKDHDIDKFAKAFDEIKNDLPEDDENIKQIQKIISNNTTVKEDIVDDTVEEIDKLINKFLNVEPVSDSDPFKNEQKLINLLGVLKDTKITETDIIDLSRMNDGYLPYIITTDNLAYMLTHDFKEPLKRKQLALLLLLNKYKNNDLYTSTGVTKVKGKTLKSDVTEDQLPDKVKEIFQIGTDSSNPTIKKLEFKGNDVINKFIMLAGKLHLNDWARNINIDKNTKPEDIQNKFEEIANSNSTSKPEIPREDNEPKVDFEKDKAHRDEILAQLQKDVQNVSYGYKTPIVRSFPRYNIEQVKADIETYFNDLQKEVESHLEYISNLVSKDVAEKSKKLNSDDYWNSSIKTASLYNKTLKEEGVGKLLVNKYFQNKENARQERANRRAHAKEDFSDNINRATQWVKNAKAQQDGKKGSGDDYSYNDDGKSKGESRIAGSLETYKKTCQDLINSQKHECSKLLDRATERVSADVYRSNTRKITEIMQDTKRKLKEKEQSFEKVVLKGNLKKRIQDFVIDKTDEKDPNKNAYDEDQKTLKINAAAENLFNKNNSTKTQQIAKWVLAKLILQFDNYTPKQMLSTFEQKFSALNNLGGTFHANVIYNIDNIKNLTTKHGEYTVTNFANIEPSAHYETPMQLFRATLDGFKNVGLGNLELLKNIKSALKNNGFKSNIEEFSKEMDLYFKARTQMQNVMKHLQPPATTTSINTEKYVKSLAESIFGNNGRINMVWEEGEQEPVQTNNVDKNAIFTKFGALTSSKLSELLGVGAGKINFNETGPEDLAAIQQFIHSELAVIQDGTEYYVYKADKTEELLKALSGQPTEAEKQATDANQKQQMADMQKQQDEQAVKQHGELNNGTNSLEMNNTAVQALTHQADQGGMDSVATEPKATVTTGAVGDVTIPQRLPSSQDVMKRKLNYTTYTYKNGPITVQKRKYDD